MHKKAKFMTGRKSIQIYFGRRLEKQTDKEKCYSSKKRSFVLTDVRINTRTHLQNAPAHMRLTTVISNFLLSELPLLDFSPLMYFLLKNPFSEHIFHSFLPKKPIRVSVYTMAPFIYLSTSWQIATLASLSQQQSNRI